MGFSHRAGRVNPRLGTYFGIFISAFVALPLLALILEGLGTPREQLELVMLFGPITLFATIGLAGFTRDPLDYFTAGRRVPAFYTGLVMAQTAMGATGLVALTGTFFLVGFDALCIVIGGLSGFVLMAVLLAPFYRKFGAYTLPSYLGRRFDSLTLRLVAGGVLAVPMLLMLAAELQIGAYAASWILGFGSRAMVIALMLTVVITVVAGGMRSASYSSAAQSIAALVALLVPVGIVAVLLTNLPLPQLSAGPVLRMIGRAEAAQGLPIILPPQLAFDVPGQGLSAIGKRYSDAFGSVGPVAFVVLMLSILGGVASAPWLLPRVAATPGVYEARKSIGWATLIFGLSMLTLASVAIFMRDYLMDVLAVRGQFRLPEWLSNLRDLGVISIVSEGDRPTIANVSIERDAVLFTLPLAAELPRAVLYLAAVGAIAAALATAGSLATSLGNVLAEDVVFGLSWLPEHAGPRLAVSRIALVTAVVAGGLIALLAPTDPLNLMLWALGLTGAAGFPVLVLSIWWKRLNVFGALAGLATGFGVTVLAIIAGEAGWTGVDSALAGAIGLPAACVAAVAVSLATPSPSRHVLELLRDIRVPGGEILYDREMRYLRKQKVSARDARR